MAEAKSLFRKVSLDRLSSPEELDQNLKVTRPFGKVAIGALIFLALSGLAWSIMGSSPIKVAGNGMLMYGSGITTVTALGTGSVTDVGVQVGDRVEKGQTIMRIDQPDIISEIEKYERQLLDVQQLSMEEMLNSPGRLSSDIYNEFSPIIQEIKQYEIQRDSQLLEFGNTTQQYDQELAKLELAIELAQDKVDVYERLYGDWSDEDYVNAQASNGVQTSIVDDSGNYYVRNSVVAAEITVYDTAGNLYVIITDDPGDMPSDYLDQSGTQNNNPTATYRLPGTAGSLKVPTIYFQSGTAYIDRVGGAFTRVSEMESVVTLDESSFLQQIASARDELEQAELNLENFLEQGTDYMGASLDVTNAAIAQLYERFEQTKIIKEQDIALYLDDLQEQMMSQGEVVCTVDGTVLEVNFTRGDLLQAGTAVCRIIEGGEAVGGDEVVLYIPANEATQVAEGMRVNISPTTVNSQEYGGIIGTVKAVSPYAVSSQRMMNTLNSEQLVQMFIGESAQVEVEVELLRSNDTVSGYEWTTPMGAPFSIDGGTLCTAQVTVGYQRPIQTVIPFIRKLLFGSDTE